MGPWNPLHSKDGVDFQCIVSFSDTQQGRAGSLRRGRASWGTGSSLSCWIRTRKGWNQHAPHTATGISWSSQGTGVEHNPTLSNFSAPSVRGPYHWVPTGPISFSEDWKKKSKPDNSSHKMTKHMLWYRKSEAGGGEIQRLLTTYGVFICVALWRHYLNLFISHRTSPNIFFSNGII